MKIKKLTFKKFNRDVFLLYCLLAVIIFQSGTVQAAINATSLFFAATRLIMVLIAAYFSIRSLKIIERKEKNLFIILTVALEIIAVINFTLYPKPFLELQYKIWLFLMLYLLFCWARKKDKRIDELLYVVLFIIAQVTLVLYLLIEIFQLPIPYTVLQMTMDYKNSFAYKDYLYIYYSYSSSFPPRMSGLFWEPGVNQIYLNLALFFYYILNKKNIYQFIILVTSVLFTQSATGYMIMFVLVAVIFSRKLKAKKWTKFVINFLFGIFGMMCSTIVFLQKKDNTNFIGDSYAVRLHDLLVGFDLFKENPFFGRGFYNTEIFLVASAYHDGNSNGLLTMLYTTGLVGLLFLLGPFIYKLLFLRRNIVEMMLWVFFVLMINLSEPIYSLPIMMYIMARAYSSIIN